jgi:hypothetical protein
MRLSPKEILHRRTTRSKNAISVALPLAILVGVILAVLGSYYVVSVLPGSWPGAIPNPNYTGTSTTLTGNLTTTGITYVPEHSKTPAYSTIYINNGAADGRVPAFNPVNSVVMIGLNNTVFFRNADSNATEVIAPSVGLNTSMLSPYSSCGPTNPTAVCQYKFVFNTAGTYNFWIPLYTNNNNYLNGTITVMS